MKIKQTVFPVAVIVFLLFVAGCDSKEEKLVDEVIDYQGGVGVAVADMNGDGHLDIVSVAPSVGVKFFENDGNDSFFDIGVIANEDTLNSPGSVGIAVAYIDENDIPDIVIISPSTGIKIIKNPVLKK